MMGGGRAWPPSLLLFGWAGDLGERAHQAQNGAELVEADAETVQELAQRELVGGRVLPLLVEVGGQVGDQRHVGPLQVRQRLLARRRQRAEVVLPALQERAPAPA